MKAVSTFRSLALGIIAFFAVTATGVAKTLTLKSAHELALERYPRITVAQLQALVAEQAVREARSGFFPNLSATLGGVVTADENTRIATTALPVSSVFNRASAALNLTQLVTDFGRTANLTESSKLLACAAEQNVEATRAIILLAVDAAYFGVLQAKAVLRVADETVKSRQLVRDQVSALAKNQLKSELDASFAEVNLQEAKLGRLRAENEVQSSFATLSALLDWSESESFQVAEEPMPGPLPPSVSKLICLALDERPELLRLRMERDSAQKLAKAENALRHPTLNLQGTAGIIPYREGDLNQDFAAGGLVVSQPLYNGKLYDARRQAAALRAQSVEAVLHEQEITVTRDVRIAWFNASNAKERLAVVAKLLEQAELSYSLADARYTTGTSSIVELSQAQLNLFSAKLTAAAARYEYFTRRSALSFQTGQLK
jgi:outer membrane protein